MCMHVSFLYTFSVYKGGLSVRYVHSAWACHSKTYTDTWYMSLTQCKKGKGTYSSLLIDPWQSYGASFAIWDHTALPVTRQVSMPRLNRSHAGGIRFTYPGGMEGWVDRPCYLVAQLLGFNSRPLCPESNALTTEPPSNLVLCSHICSLHDIMLQFYLVTICSQNCLILSHHL